jgi:hypothetical protein
MDRNDSVSGFIFTCLGKDRVRPIGFQEAVLAAGEFRIFFASTDHTFKPVQQRRRVASLGLYIEGSIVERTAVNHWATHLIPRRSGKSGILFRRPLHRGPK